MFYVYALQSATGEFYIGYTADLRARLQSHNSDRNRATRGRTWRLVYYELTRPRPQQDSASESSSMTAEAGVL